MNILIVDDEREIADIVELYLQNEYRIFKFYTGEEALACIENTKIDLAILDVMLPDVDGFAILRKIREKYTFPVIMLTAKTEYLDKITGLTMGADDYIPKPFNPLELVARVKAQLRRYTQYNDHTKEQGDIIDFGGLFLNKESHECVYNEKSLTLTPIEFDILWMLCENRGKVVSSERLFESVWNENYYKNSNNTVMVHIRHLREKMSGPTGKSDLIKTVWGVGYKIEE
ncbi:MAG: VanR-ABDEGLN family response regulator transcription factor [Coprococcus sp.]|nr:VanR-ABDEGLN family response regulator transcription factor [Coprococcus sp.]